MASNDRAAKTQQEKLLEIIRVQTEIAQSPLELEKVVETAAGTALRLTGSDGAAVELADGGDMVYRTAVGIAASQLGLRMPKAGSLSGRCVETGTVLYCEDAEADERVNKAACRAVGLRSMVVVPLLYRRETVGVLKVMKSAPKGFEQSDIETLDLVSGLIAAHMAQAAQYQSRVDESEALLLAATHDSLTGLNNRSAFYDYLRQSLAAAKRYSEAVGVALLDMDGLKAINDTYGHRAGDLALRTLAERLKNGARESDVAARLGGDEFGVLFPRLEDRSASATLAGRLSEIVRGPVDFNGAPLLVQASVGVAVFPEDGDDPEQLMNVADAAMYAMKRSRKAERKG